MERYYQIARCYRDEDFRADRQPEFTQLDIEMSFVDQDDVIELAEEIVTEIWKLKGVDVGAPFLRLPYAEAMARYGSDKPDLRFDLEITEVTDFFADTPFRVFQAPYVGAVVMAGGGSQPRRTFDAWQEWAKQRGAKGLAYVTFDENGELGGPVAKNISDAERAGLAARVGAQPGDCVFFGAGAKTASQSLLGAARLEIGRRLGRLDENAHSFLWVLDAPLFKPVSEAVAEGDVAVGGGAWTAVHHAFTSPKPECMDTFDTDPGSALAYAYDIVYNGNEIGGGSIRIHRRDVQERVFKVMGLSARGGAGEVRLPARRLHVRRPAARRHRLRLGPHRRAPRRVRVDPRGHRVPEVRWRLRPAHRCSGAHQPRTAQRGWRRLRREADTSLTRGPQWASVTSPAPLRAVTLR